MFMLSSFRFEDYIAHLASDISRRAVLPVPQALRLSELSGLGFCYGSYAYVGCVRLVWNRYQKVLGIASRHPTPP